MIIKSEAECIEQKEGNVDELEKKMAEETEKIVQLIEKVTTSELLMRADTPPKEALDEAAKIKKKFDASVERLNQY